MLGILSFGPRDFGAATVDALSAILNDMLGPRVTVGRLAGAETSSSSSSLRGRFLLAFWFEGVANVGEPPSPPVLSFFFVYARFGLPFADDSAGVGGCAVAVEDAEASGLILSFKLMLGARSGGAGRSGAGAGASLFPNVILTMPRYGDLTTLSELTCW